MKILASTLILALCIVTLCRAAPPAIDAVVNAASFSGNLAPGCWATVFGNNLADATAAARTVPLPTQISGVTVKVNDIAAPALFTIDSSGKGKAIAFDASFQYTTGRFRRAGVFGHVRGRVVQGELRHSARRQAV
jgi:hypothetical protein